MKTIKRTFKKSSAPFSQYSFELAEYYPRWLETNNLEPQPGIIQWLVDTVEPNWTCFEVGGHVGEITLLLSQLASRVITFEPHEDIVQMLRGNIKYNQDMGSDEEFLNIEVIARPVGQYSGIMAEKFQLHQEDYKEIVKEHNFLTLDKFARYRDDINWVNLILLNADGWNYEALLGSEFIINKCHPYIIIDTSSLAWRGHREEEVYKWIDMHHYDGKYLEDKGSLLLIPINNDTYYNSVYISE